MVQALARGETGAGPLFLPVVFSLGSKLEGLPLRSFLGNPTKIANALKQLHGVLRCDGLACYFDGLLEAEALGCQVGWTDPDGAGRRITAAPAAPPDLSPEALARAGRIPVALEVVRRLKVTLAEPVALVAGVTGPFTLATRLAGGSSPSPALLERAAEAVRLVATGYLEAGLNVLLLVEEELSGPERLPWWQASVTPVANVVRFYEALPAVLLPRAGPFARALLGEPRAFVLCLPLGEESFWREAARAGAENLGVALPAGLLAESEAEFDALRGAAERLIRAQRPVLLTTAGDLPLGIDMRALPPRIHALRALAHP